MRVSGTACSHWTITPIQNSSCILTASKNTTLRLRDVVHFPTIFANDIFRLKRVMFRDTRHQGCSKRGPHCALRRTTLTSRQLSVAPSFHDQVISITWHFTKYHKRLFIPQLSYQYLTHIITTQNIQQWRILFSHRLTR